MYGKAGVEFPQRIVCLTSETAEIAYMVGAGDTKTPAIDSERDEALNILADLVDLSRGPKTASANNVDKTAPEQRP